MNVEDIQSKTKNNNNNKKQSKTKDFAAMGIEYQQNSLFNLYYLNVKKNIDLG